MQVFKGAETDSGVNWTEPAPVDTTPQSKNWEAGRAIFLANCASCHKLGWDMTGPDLLGVEDRWGNRNDLKRWIRNWEDAAQAGIPRALRAINLKGTAMNKFDFASDQQLEQVLWYIRNESSKPRQRLDDNNKSTPDTSSYDPICIDTIYIPSAPFDKSFFDSSNLDNMPTPPVEPMTPPPAPGTYYDHYPTSGRYTFKVNANGWYNIDAYMDEENTIIVKVKAQLEIHVVLDAQVFLFIPGRKILLQPSGRYRDSYFFETYGNMPIRLFKDDRAVLLAVGSKDDKMYCGIIEFTIAPNMVVTFSVKESTADEIRNALLSKQMEGIDLGIEKNEMRIRENICEPAYPKIDSAVTN